jgi:hypothetical protein
MVTAVYERYTTIEECDLYNLGGLNDIRQVTYQSILNNTSYNLIMPPETHPGDIKEDKVYKIRFDHKWFDDAWYRMGRLKLYINGYYFMVIENFEEIIPRELNTEKEKQIGVPFNISWGGGTQGLHDHLIFSATTALNGPYKQDPELFPNNILSATTLSGLSTNILLEQNFGGTFMGGLSQFRMYTEAFSSPQVQHDFRILKDKFNLFNYWCPNCLTPNSGCTSASTHTHSLVLYSSVSGIGNITGSLSGACSAQACLNANTCNTVTGINVRADVSVPVIGTRFYSTSTGCTIANSLNGYYAFNNSGTYTTYEITNGIVTCVSRC